MTTEENLIQKLSTTVIALSVAFSGMAIDYKKVVRTQKFDAQSMIEMQRMQQAEQYASAAAKSFGTSSAKTYVAPRVSALVKLHDGMDASSLSDRGFDMTPLCNNFGIVSVSADSLEALAEVDDVERISFGGQEMELMLHKANQMTGVDLVHEGTFGNGLSERSYSFISPYTGKGSLIGIFDTGFDPNHAMFLDENDVSRFKMIATKNMVTEDSAKIASFHSDSYIEGHATHVSGIAAGHYIGDTYELQGVAPGADLAMAPYISTAEDLTYLVKMAEYCQEHGKRLITNMSYGTFFGPHDGSDIFLQALDEIINKYDIVACISSGNSADHHIVQKHIFTGDDDEMKAIYDTYNSNNSIKNYIATDNATPIDIQLAIIDFHNEDTIKTYKIVDQGEVIPLEPDDSILLSTVNVAKEEIHDGLSGYAIKANDLKLGNSDYRIGYIIHAQKGQKVSSYTDDKCPLSMEFAKWKEGMTSNGAINDLACANEVIAVGAYNSTASMDLKNGKKKPITNPNAEAWGEKEGEITYYSSFGTRYDGQELPHICAPGAYLESAFNRYNRSRSAKNTITHNDVYKGDVYSFCAMGGTSMSSPYMAGIAALWLEANPNLTHKEIKEIAMKTANNDEACNEGNHFKEEGRQAGAGKVDAYAGLKYILDEMETTLIATPSEKKFWVRPVSATQYEAYLAGASSLTATLYNMEGKKMNSTSQAGSTITMSTDGLPKGIYVLSVKGNNQARQMKIAVK